MELHISELRDEIERVNQLFEMWSGSKEKALQEDINKRKKMIEEDKENIRCLTRNENELKIEAKKVAFCQQREEKEIELVSIGLAPLKYKQKTLPIQLQEIRNGILEAEKKVAENKKVVEELENWKNNQIIELTKGCNLYRQRLGLYFEYAGENRLYFIFTNIDPNCHEREFVFMLSLNEQNIFVVEKCQPQIQNVPQLLQQLNKTKDYSTFVRGMRKKFREYVASDINGF